MDKQFIVKSLLAGFMIGLGCLVNVVCDNKFIGAFLFSLGLLSVILQQHNLYTGKVGYISRKTAPMLIPMFLINAVGIGVTCWLASLTRLDISKVYSIVEIKLADNYFSIFLLSIGCGAMMYLAVDNYKKNSHPLIVIMPIMFFILCGFEHCVANVGYFAMAHTPISVDLCLRVATMVVGNGVGSCLLSLTVRNNAAG